MKIILFDGICNLCNSTIKFIIKRDVNNEFMFASLQSKFGKSFLKEKGLNEKNFTTIILIEDDKFYTKSEAVLRVFKRLPRYKLLKAFLFVPKSLRDYLYLFISRNRYFLFGKKQETSCIMSTKDLSSKFVEE
jgi:predicted DCC family thiol-disulfide oxidoreductase YuxK